MSGALDDDRRRERDARWLAAFRAGEPCSVIGRRDGVSGERVRQVVRAAGYGYHDGGLGLGLKGAAADRAALDRAAQRENRRGLPKGVYHQVRGYTFRAQFRGRHIGNFASIDDALAARRAAELAEVEVMPTPAARPAAARDPDHDGRR